MGEQGAPEVRSRVILRISYVEKPEEVKKALRIPAAACRRSIMARLGQEAASKQIAK